MDIPWNALSTEVPSGPRLVELGVFVQSQRAASHLIAEWPSRKMNDK